MIAFNSARLPAYFFTRFARFCSRLISASFAMATSVSERKFKCGEQRFRFLVGLCSRRDADIQTTQCINLVVLDLGENDLLFHTDVVVTTTIECLARHTTEIAHARQRNRNETIKEFIHLRTAQGHHATDRIAFTNLETRNSFTRLGNDWLLTSDLGQITDSMLDHFLVSHSFRQTHIKRDLLDARHFHHRLVRKLRSQISNDFFFVELLETGHDLLTLYNFAARLVDTDLLTSHVFEASAICLAGCRIEQRNIRPLNRHQLINDATGSTRHRIWLDCLFGDINALNNDMLSINATLNHATLALVL